MITSPLCRSLCGPIASALTTPRASSPAAPAGTTWDAANKSATCTLSGGDLVASTLDFNSGRAKTTTSRNSGTWALKFTATYGADPGDDAVSIGVAAATWSPVTESLFDATEKAGLSSSGHKITNFANLSIPFASGESAFVYGDSDTGMVWVDDESNTYAADREAGTNPHFTLTANAALVGGFDAFSLDGITPTAVTLDPSHSSGRFAAWDS